MTTPIFWGTTAAAPGAGGLRSSDPSWHMHGWYLQNLRFSPWRQGAGGTPIAGWFFLKVFLIGKIMENPNIKWPEIYDSWVATISGYFRNPPDLVGFPDDEANGETPRHKIWTRDFWVYWAIHFKFILGIWSFWDKSGSFCQLGSSFQVQ